MQPMPRVADAIERLKGVFLEIPGTQLSVADATRLSGLDRNTCGAVLHALEDVRFIKRASNGLFVRRAADTPHPV
jgi:hypothetical protein